MKTLLLPLLIIISLSSAGQNKNKNKANEIICSLNDSLFVTKISTFIYVNKNNWIKIERGNTSKDQYDGKMTIHGDTIALIRHILKESRNREKEMREQYDHLFEVSISGLNRSIHLDTIGISYLKDTIPHPRLSPLKATSYCNYSEEELLKKILWRKVIDNLIKSMKERPYSRK